MSMYEFLPLLSKRRLSPTGRGEGEQPLHSLQRQMNRLFENFFSDFEMSPFQGFSDDRGEFVPRITVRDQKDNLIVEAELPGMKHDDIEVTIREDSLVLRGEKKTQSTSENADELYSERSFGMFERVIPLPFKADDAAIDARFSNGVLTITVPKPAEAHQTRKKITIEPSH